MLSQRGRTEGYITVSMCISPWAGYEPGRRATDGCVEPRKLPVFFPPSLPPILASFTLATFFSVYPTSVSLSILTCKMERMTALPS